MTRRNKKKPDDYNIIWSDKWEDVYQVCISYRHGSIDLYQNGKKILSKKGLKYFQLKVWENQIKSIHIDTTDVIDKVIDEMINAIFGSGDDNSSYSFGFD